MSDINTKEEMEQEDMQANNREDMQANKEEHEVKDNKVVASEQVQNESEEQEEREAKTDPASQEEESEHDELALLQTKLAEAEQKAEENYQKFLRAQADLDNFRRRTRKEKEDQAKYASLPLVEQLLPVLDNFERALAASQEAKDIDTLAKGVEMVFRQIQETLQKEGLEVIESVGTPFDPSVHQAVMMVESEEYESGFVVEEIQKGYKLKDRVIRPAMVKVNS